MNLNCCTIRCVYNKQGLGKSTLHISAYILLWVDLLSVCWSGQGHAVGKGKVFFSGEAIRLTLNGYVYQH